MSRANFTKAQNEFCDLAIDLIHNDYERNDKLTKRDYENHLRDIFNKDIAQGRTMYQALRRNKYDVYEILEEVVNTGIGEDVLDSPFINSFVEVKNRALGDKTSWYHEGGLLTVASFAGNHWDTNRQSLDIGEEFTLPREWCYIHVYDEFERFLLGISTLDKFMDKIQKSFDKYMNDRIYLQFQNVASSVPLDFVANGNSEDSLGTLCDKVQAYGGYSSLTIAGTKGALRKLARMVPDKMFAPSQKESKANSGDIGEWEGNRLMAIPQAFKSGTFNLALDDSQLFILGGDSKPIKLEWIGDTRTKEITDEHINNDMSYEYQIQTCFGLGMIVPGAFGIYNIDTI